MIVRIQIENWKLVNRRNMEVSPAFGNQLGIYPIHICGEVSGHPHIHDGSVMTTAPISSFDGCNFLTDDGVAVELGETLAVYESRHPRARQKLQARFQKQHKEKHYVSSEPPYQRIAENR